MTNALEVTVENINKTGPARWTFEATVALDEGSRLLIRDNVIMRTAAGRYLLFLPSRFRDSQWVEQVVPPSWLRNALRDAVLRELQAMQANEAVQ
jgi:hypothetical protein